MASTFTANLNLDVPARGDYPGTWDEPANANYEILDGAIGSMLSLDVSGGNITINTAQATEYAQYYVFGDPGGATRTITFPDGREYVKQFYLNLTSGAVQVKCNTASTTMLLADQASTGVMFGLFGGANVEPRPANTGTHVGVPVGSSISFRGFSIPTHISGSWALEYGQAISRTTYPILLGALTKAVTATRANGNATLTSVSSTFQLGPGMGIEGTGIAGGATIVSITANTIVMSAAASGSGSITATVFPYGAGNGSTTFNLPDARGRTDAGADNMGAVSADRLVGTITNSVDGDVLGAAGGIEGAAVDKTNLTAFSLNHNLTLPNHAHSDNFSIASAGLHDHSLTYGTGNNSIGHDLTTRVAGCGSAPPSGTSRAAVSSDGTHTHTLNGSVGNPTSNPAINGSVTSGGSSTALSKVQPTIITNKIIRIL